VISEKNTSEICLHRHYRGLATLLSLTLASVHSRSSVPAEIRNIGKRTATLSGGRSVSVSVK
jgi:hypothetical protein